MGICLILGGSKPLPGWFGALIQRWTWTILTFKHGNLEMVKLRLKKSAVFECGGRGCNCYLGNAHIEVALIWKVLPLMFCEYICNFHAGINSIFVLWEQANPIMKPRPPFAGISAQGSLHWSLAEMDWCWFIDDNIKRYHCATDEMILISVS